MWSLRAPHGASFSSVHRSGAFGGFVLPRRVSRIGKGSRKQNSAYTRFRRDRQGLHGSLKNLGHRIRGDRPCFCRTERGTSQVGWGARGRRVSKRCKKCRPERGGGNGGGSFESRCHGSPGMALVGMTDDGLSAEMTRSGSARGAEDADIAERRLRAGRRSPTPGEARPAPNPWTRSHRQEQPLG
jgi:hypothetical protein